METDDKKIDSIHTYVGSAERDGTWRLGVESHRQNPVSRYVAKGTRPSLSLLAFKLTRVAPIDARMKRCPAVRLARQGPGDKKIAVLAS